MTGTELIPMLEMLEVASGFFALGLAYYLQIWTDRQVDLKYWAGYYVVGCVIILSQLGILIPDPGWRAAFKFLVILILFGGQLVAAWYVWDKASLPPPGTNSRLVRFVDGGGR